MKKALKEWNTTVEALGKGKIIAIWRKGGISDSPGIKTPNSSFKVDDRRFLLLPTFTHEELDRVKKSYWEFFNQNHKLGKDNQLQVKYWAEVHEEIEIEKLEQLMNVSEELVNSDEYLVSSYNLNPSHKGKILILRVYLLNYPVLITNSNDYAGCKSWIDLNIDIPRIRSKATLSFKEFNQKVKQIKALIENSSLDTDYSTPLINYKAS